MSSSIETERVHQGVSTVGLEEEIHEERAGQGSKEGPQPAWHRVASREKHRNHFVIDKQQEPRALQDF